MHRRAAALVTFALAILTAAPQAGAFTLTIDATDTAQCTGSAQVALVLTDVPQGGVGSFGIDIFFGTTALAYDSITRGPATDNWDLITANEVSPGQLRVGGARLSGTPVGEGGPHTIAIIQFTWTCGGVQCSSTLNGDNPVNDVANATIVNDTIFCGLNQPPVARCLPIVEARYSQGTLDASQLDDGSSDPNGDALSFRMAFEGLPPLQTIPMDCALLGAIGQFDVMLEVYDENGAGAACPTVIDFIDDVPPEAIARDLTVTLDPSGNAEIAAESLNSDSTDNCGDLTFTASQTSFNCSDLGQNTLTFQAADASGNTDDDTALVTVVDSLPPSITLLGPSIMSVNCGEAFADPWVSVTDNCDGAPSVVLTGEVNTSLPGAYVLVYGAVDASGQSSHTVTRTVTVRDNCPACEADCPPLPDTDADLDGLTQCEESFFGTSDNNVDSDGDGMADAYEVAYCSVLNPGIDDATDNPDNDAFDNLEEYRRDSDPADMHSPSTTYFVAQDNAKGNGPVAAGDTFGSLSEAMDRIPMTPSESVAILVEAGFFSEDVIMRRGMSIFGATEGNTVIEGTIQGNRDCELHGVTVAGFESTGPLLTITSGAMRIHQCTFIGPDNAFTTGIAISSSDPADTEISECLFTGLDIGIEVEAGLPVLRRSIFEELDQAGIVVYCDGVEESFDQPPADDLRTGYNSFRSSINGPAVINECSTPLNMERNDWGFENPTEDLVAGRIQGEVNQAQFLSSSQVNLAANVVIVLYQEKTRTRINNALVDAGGVVATLTDAGYLMVLQGDLTYTISIQADGFAPRTIIRSPGQTEFTEFLSAAVPTEGDDDGEDPGPQPRPPCGCGNKDLGAPAAGDLLLAALVTAILFLAAVKGTPA